MTESSYGWLWLGLGGIGLVVALIVVFGWVASFKSVPPDRVCVVQEGGPFDGRDVKEVRQPSSGVGSIGIWNKQRCYPVTERTYTLSADPGEADAKTVDTFKTPTVDAVQVVIEGQARFTLNANPAVIESFYRRYGLRTYDGKYPDDGGSGWENFLAQVLRPVLLNSIREAIGERRCVELNNTCQYVLNPESATKRKVEEVETGQNLDEVGSEIATTLTGNLKRTLGGDYFENIRFNLVRIGFEPGVQQAIEAAQTKRTQVANAQLDAQAQIEKAKGEKRAAIEQARAFRIRSKANPNQPQIEALKVLCGTTGQEGQYPGCTHLQVLSGGIAKLIR